MKQRHIEYLEKLKTKLENTKTIFDTEYIGISTNLRDEIVAILGQILQDEKSKDSQCAINLVKKIQDNNESNNENILSVKTVKSYW